MKFGAPHFRLIMSTGCFLFALNSQATKTVQLSPVNDSSNLQRIYEDEVAIYSSADLVRLNEQTLEKINQQEISDSVVNANKKTFSVSEGQAGLIMKELRTNPVVSLENLLRYDPTELIGFCFGRALFTQLELLRRGVHKQSIMKAFAVGRMLKDKINWNFHVATIVKASEGGWWAIDPEFDSVMKVDDWFMKMRSYSYGDELRLYVTDAKRFSSNIGVPYIGTRDRDNQKQMSFFARLKRAFNEPVGVSQDGLFSQQYSNYFADMFKYFKENPLDITDKFIPEPKSCRMLSLFD